ncbi:serine O-acetyltransferase [Geothrix sp. PMB-07]|uniref:serine O-acetyltransferase n=1 Tax=Geothrix sp. PMB-07 TaxID=3068640 RepID=UPI0027409A68|nr:serine acetyltransferase [Geothrix sp. PMB-07]WLT32702.1 serine acetyltransferase [Geothrix sp. PMB-07]
MPQASPIRPLKRVDRSSSDFTALVAAIVASDLAEPLTRHIDAGSLPNRDAVIDLVKKLRELLFPGYFGKQNLTTQTLEYYVGELLGEIRGLLLEQILNVLRHQATRHGSPCQDVEATAESIVQTFLAAIPRLRATLATDVQAAFDGDPAAGDTDEVIFSYPGVFAITVHRIAHELHGLNVPLIPRIMSEYAHALTGVDIHPGATIGDYFFIDHGTGVVIGETTTIGQYVKIYQGVTLGALSTRGGQSLRGVKRHPTLKDRVTVYSGASILGGETVIGEEAIISSNVFVTQSVPPQTRVSVKNPELQYKDRKPQEFKQALPDDWMI